MARPVPAARLRAAAALAWATLAWLAPGAAAAEPLRIAAARPPVSLPLHVALQRGFFADCIGGRADLPTSSEMPVVLQAFGHASVAGPLRSVEPDAVGTGG